MTDDLSVNQITANKLKELLHLTPHPREGGWFVRTYEASETIPQSALDARYGGSRRTGTAIYYLLEPDTFSEMHLLQSDEIFHFYLGDPVELLQLYPDGTGKITRLGKNLTAGETPQLVVPRNVWQGSRLVPGGKFALLGCTVSPGFEFDDYASGDRNTLCNTWPDFQDRICELTRQDPTR
ncbi:MAG: cupin domain-containing protein [Acidobacteriaceae bacterium]